MREIEQFKAQKLGEACAKKSVNNMLGVLSRVLRYARDARILDEIPRFSFLKVPKPPFDFFTFDEADKLLEAAGEPWRTMLLVGLRAGLRHGEILALRWQDVDLRAGRLVVRRSLWKGQFVTPKNGLEREVPLSDELRAALQRHRHLRGELVFCKADGKLVRATACKWPLWQVCAKAGLRRVGWHVLRHTFASHLVMRGASLKSVQELLGHATMDMTMRYAHLAPEVNRSAVNLLDGAASPLRKSESKSETA